MGGEGLRVGGWGLGVRVLGTEGRGDRGTGDKEKVRQGAKSIF